MQALAAYGSFILVLVLGPSCDDSPETTCEPGFELNEGGSCTDIDECSTENGGCDLLTTCTNTGGSFKCGECPSGYTGDGDTGCADINECLTENGGCDLLATCTNTSGSFGCGECPSGYTGDGDTGCADINECEIDNGGCDLLTTCTNTGGSFECGEWPSGYTGDGDTGCADINECEIDNGGCDLLTECFNSSGSHSCGPCPTGYSGNGVTGCVCETDAFEPNDTFDGAEPIGELPETRLRLCDGDYDWFLLDATGAVSDLAVTITQLDPVTPTQFSLFERNGDGTPGALVAVETGAADKHVVVGDQVPGFYLMLVADTGDPISAAGIAYDLTVQLDCTDALEPDDDADLATPVPFNQTTYHANLSACHGDEDFFLLDVAAPGSQIDVTVDRSTPAGTLTVALLDAGADPLDPIESSSGIGVSVSLAETVDVGTYYVYIASDAANAGELYDVTFDVSEPYVCTDDYESNDDVAEASDLGLSLAGDFFARLCQADVDYFGIDLATGADDFTITVTSPDGLPELELLDSTESVIATGVQMSPTSRRIVESSLPADSYFIRVSGSPPTEQGWPYMLDYSVTPP